MGQLEFERYKKRVEEATTPLRIDQIRNGVGYCMKISPEELLELRMICTKRKMELKEKKK